jgi:antitoxin component HigA of HigAB toxin-antitoxin module
MMTATVKRPPVSVSVSNPLPASLEMVADLIADYEATKEQKAKPLPVPKCLAGLLEAHSMTAADLGRLLELELSMGSKILNGTRQLTTAHIRRLARHFALPADYFLEA